VEVLNETLVKKVMLVDDDPSCNFILGEFISLVSSNIKKITSFSVDESFELLQSENEFPEVIFLDLNMPIKSGFDFLKKYMEDYYMTHPNTRIYVLTSSLRPSDREKTLAFKCVSDYKSKSEIDKFIGKTLLASS